MEVSKNFGQYKDSVNNPKSNVKKSMDPKNFDANLAKENLKQPPTWPKTPKIPELPLPLISHSMITKLRAQQTLKPTHININPPRITTK